MLRICRNCSKQYEGNPASTLCPSCVREQKATTIRDRICRNCGATFPGGPRAWYCPTCRADRQAAREKEQYWRKKAGHTRQLGSTDICSVCGQPYTVTSGNQRYCPKCAPEIIREKDRAQARSWASQNAPPEERRERRRAGTAELLCKVCGKPFKPHYTSQTCSKACSELLAKQNAAAWEAAHKPQRNQYHRERAKIKKENNDE